MRENLLVLEVQISSASGELQELRAEQDELTPLAAIRGRICYRCHQSGHTKTSVGFCRGSRVEGKISRVEGRGSRVEGRGSRVEGRGSRVEGRG